MDFLPFLSGLLSLTDQKSAERLELALPAIKDQCIGMGFDEIKIMFEKYADGKMSIKPIPNYFDRILLGKIVNEYKSTKIKKVTEQPKKPTEAEINRIMLDAFDRIKAEVKEFGSIQGSAHHIYDFVTKRGQIIFSDAEKKAAFSISKREIISDEKNKAIGNYELKKKLKHTLAMIENGSNSRVIINAKKLLLENYFLSLRK